MIPFPHRKATTTAEPSEPLESFVVNVLFNQYILQGIVGPAAKHSGKNLCNLCFLKHLVAAISRTKFISYCLWIFDCRNTSPARRGHVVQERRGRPPRSLQMSSAQALRSRRKRPRPAQH